MDGHAPAQESRFTHVHQVLPSLHVADASGAHTLHARDALRSAGYKSEIFVDQVDPALAHEARSFDELDGRVAPDATAILYQLAVGSRLVDKLIARKEPLLVNYHNLTPASFFWKWAPDWLDAVALGRSQLHALASRTSHAIAVSEFNERDLRGAGYLSTSVVPPFVDVASREPSPSRDLDSDHAPLERATTWLFVGKLLPHKAAHDLVRALAAYRRAYDPRARLVLVGGHPVASYATAVREYAEVLGLGEAVEITGATTSDELASAYATADVFVCLSDHEGFCFPLLEAMNHGLPVVAYSAGAVPDTLADSGILLGDKAGPSVATAVHRVLTDERLRARLVAGGHARLRAFDLGRTKSRFGDEIRRALWREELKRGAEPTGPERKFVAPAVAVSAGGVRIAKGLAGRGPEPVRAVHQLVPMLVPGDATSDHAIQLRRLIRDMGLESEIFASAIHDSLHEEGMLVHELPDRTLPGTLLVYQLSSGSPMVETARERKEPLALNYHNLTPAHTYDGWDPAIAADQRWARRQLGSLASRTTLAICDSAYNAAELVSYGYGATAVCPVLVDMTRFGSPTSANGKDSLEQRTAKGIASWLFVGRIAPHKAQHRLVQALAAHERLYGTGARLDLVGRPGSARYADAVRRCAKELGVADLVEMVGGVDDVELGAYYRQAHVLLSASVHEGFGVPIVEAMHHGVPVVALAAAAVPETIGGAGLLVSSADAGTLSAAAHSVFDDENLRDRLVRAGRARAEQLSLEHSRATMRRVLEHWIDARGHFANGSVDLPALRQTAAADATVGSLLVAAR